MRRPGFQDGTMVPPQKPEPPKATFIEKMQTLKEMKGRSNMFAEIDDMPKHPKERPVK